MIMILEVLGIIATVLCAIFLLIAFIGVFAAMRLSGQISQDEENGETPRPKNK